MAKSFSWRLMRMLDLLCFDCGLLLITLQLQNDRDSSIGDEASVAISSTASLSSSILDFRQENGRTYHGYKEGSPFSFASCHPTPLTHDSRILPS